MFSWYAENPVEIQSGSSSDLEVAVRQVRKALIDIGGGEAKIMKEDEPNFYVKISNLEYKFKEVRCG